MARLRQPKHETVTVSPMEILIKLRMIIRAATQHSSWVEKQCGVTGAQLWIIKELHEAGATRVGDLARKLAIHRTTTSNLLEGLEKRGYVAKARDKADQRVVTVTLTDSGATLLNKAPLPARGLLPEALRHLDDASLAQLNGGLQSLIDSIEVLDDAFGRLPMPFMM